MFYLMRSLIALHLSDSPTDLIPRPGAQKFKHPSAASAATPFALALPAASSKLLLATAPLSSALFGWHYYNALSFFVKHLFRVFSRTKSSFSKKTDRKNDPLQSFAFLRNRPLRQFSVFRVRLFIPDILKSIRFFVRNTHVLWAFFDCVRSKKRIQNAWQSIFSCILTAKDERND